VPDGNDRATRSEVVPLLVVATRSPDPDRFGRQVRGARSEATLIRQLRYFWNVYGP
jgi:hypothetical protein